MNRIFATMKSAEPVIGMGATELLYTDRHAGTIVEVSMVSGTPRVGWARDKAKRIDKLGMTDSGQQYEYERNPDAAVEYFTLRKNGSWVKLGQGLKNGRVLMIGARDEYYDFSF